MSRDSDKTKGAILKAVGELLAESGFQGIGINAVARKAGVDKVLIYRYFGSLEELLAEYGRKGDFWPTNETLLGGVEGSGEMGLAELGETVLNRHLDHLLSSPVTREVMRWELSQRNELTDLLAKLRELQGIDLLNIMGAVDSKRELDIPAIAAVLHAGLSYLALRSDSADVYLGVSLRDEEGWSRVRGAVHQLSELMFHGGEGE